MKELDQLKYYGDSIVIPQSMAIHVPVEYDREFYFQDGQFLCKLTQNFGDVRVKWVNNVKRTPSKKCDMYVEWREYGISPSDFI